MNYYQQEMEKAVESFWEHINTFDISEDEYKRTEELLIDVMGTSAIYGFAEGFAERRNQEDTKENAPI